MRRQAILTWGKVIAFSCLAAHSYAEVNTAVPVPLTPQKDTETLHLPLDQSLGLVVEFSCEKAEERRGIYTDRIPRRIIGEAQGTIEMPLGDELGLAPSPFASYDPNNADVKKLLSRVTQLYTCGVFTLECHHEPKGRDDTGTVHAQSAKCEYQCPQ